MKIHHENAKLEPFSRAKMVSAADYAAALTVPGSFNWKKAVRTLLVQMNLNFLLPMTAFIKSQQKDDSGIDPFELIGGSDAAYAILRDAFSPLHLYAIGTHPSHPSRSAPNTCQLQLHAGVSHSDCHVHSLPHPGPTPAHAAIRSLKKIVH